MTGCCDCGLGQISWTSTGQHSFTVSAGLYTENTDQTAMSALCSSSFAWTCGRWGVSWTRTCPVPILMYIVCHRLETNSASLALTTCVNVNVDLSSRSSQYTNARAYLLSVPVCCTRVVYTTCMSQRLRWVTEQNLQFSVPLDGRLLTTTRALTTTATKYTTQKTHTSLELPHSRPHYHY